MALKSLTSSGEWFYFLINLFPCWGGQAPFWSCAQHILGSKNLLTLIFVSMLKVDTPNSRSKWLCLSNFSHFQTSNSPLIKECFYHYYFLIQEEKRKILFYCFKKDGQLDSWEHNIAYSSENFQVRFNNLMLKPHLWSHGPCY